MRTRPGSVAESMGHGPDTAADSATVREAETAFAAWLDASMEQAGQPARRPVAQCDDGGASFPSPLLADYDMLPSQLRGDTVVARASVITVAEQDVDRRAGDRFVARQRVRTDVLEWDVVPGDDGWSVCNGIRFGYLGADSLTRWVPDGASIRTARALADSIRGTRAIRSMRAAR